MKLAQPSPPIDLDNPSAYLPLDSAGITKLTIDFPAQCRHAISIADTFTAPDSFAAVHNILLCGLGGSAIAGDLVAALLADRLPVPFAVNRSYSLPAWVGPNTLVILSSYSGNTEETLSVAQQALAKKAQIAAITSGGKLKNFAGRHNLPLIQIPSGQPPRASTGYLIFPLLAILEKSNLPASTPAEKAEALARLDTLAADYSPDTPTDQNSAKKTALLLHNKLPFIYGWGCLAPVARRWQTQLNENAKLLAHAGQLPEMNHNEIVAWAHDNPAADHLVHIHLRSPEEPPRIRARFELTKRIVGAPTPILENHATGASRLARQLSLTYLGDFASLYLAFLNHKDPAEINAINFLKGELAKLPV